MKKLVVAVMALFCLFITDIFGRESVCRPVLVDYEGKAEGKEVPEWAINVASGNYSPSGFIKYYPEVKDMQLFIESSRDRDLKNCFMKVGIDIIREIKYAEKRQISTAINSNGSLKGTSVENNIFSTYEDLDLCNAFYSSIKKLKPICSFWCYCNEVDSAGNIVDKYYDCYAVWGYDKACWEEIIQVGVNGNLNKYIYDKYNELSQEN